MSEELSHVVNVGRTDQLFPQLGLLVPVVGPFLSLRSCLSLWGCQEGRVIGLCASTALHTAWCAPIICWCQMDGVSQPSAWQFWWCFKRRKSVQIEYWVAQTGAAKVVLILWSNSIVCQGEQQFITRPVVSKQLSSSVPSTA